METIKSDFGVLEEKNGMWNIIIPPEKFFYAPATQYEIKDMEVRCDGRLCVVSGMKTEHKEYNNFSLEKWTEQEIKDAEFRNQDIKYKDKTIWHWFGKNQTKVIPYLNGYVRLKKREPIKITTLHWTIIDRREPVATIGEVPTVITDHSQMD